MNAGAAIAIDKDTADRLQAEILDDQATISGAGMLSELLRDWNEVVREEAGSEMSFAVYDMEAGKQQRLHRWVVVVGAVTGAGAVLLGILQMALFARPTLLPKNIAGVLEAFEIIITILALVAVVLGIFAALHTRWRMERMKAEHYPFVKANFLLSAQPWLWKSSEERRDHLKTELAALHALTAADARFWSQGRMATPDSRPEIKAPLDPAIIEKLVPYFLQKRIIPQREYFERQGHKRRHIERTTWYIAPACFFLSIACALFHVIAGKVSGEDAQRAPGSAALFFLFASAAFPVIGAAVRTIRGAFEFGRNATRFEGVRHRLCDIEANLDTTASPAARFELIREAERVLANEHQSWMRLMTEAEWFG